MFAYCVIYRAFDIEKCAGLETNIVLNDMEGNNGIRYDNNNNPEFHYCHTYSSFSSLISLAIFETAFAKWFV